MTMVALCFANGLQGAEGQGFAQATESLKHGGFHASAFHVTDTWIGVAQFGSSVSGAIGALLIAGIASRHARTKVLGVMFAIWSVLLLVLGMAAALPAALGFAMFGVVKAAIGVTEATDPAALPLIGDYYPAEQRAAKVSVFNAGAALGAFAGLVVAGALVDKFGWQWAFWPLVPGGLVGAYLMATRAEPERGVQDSDFSNELIAAAEADDIVAALVAGPIDEYERADRVLLDLGGRPVRRADVLRRVLKVRSWRYACIGIGIAQVMLNGLQFWGLAYFKRTFHLSSAKAALLAPIIGAPTFLGLLFGGFIADRLLARGNVRARVYVSAAGYIGAGIALGLAFSTHRLLVAAPILALGACLLALPTGPQFALLLDVTPVSIRSQAAAAANIVQFVSAVGPFLVGALSAHVFSSNLRLALLCASPICTAGGVLVFMARRSYIADVAAVVADARNGAG